MFEVQVVPGIEISEFAEASCAAAECVGPCTDLRGTPSSATRAFRHPQAVPQWLGEAELGHAHL